MNRDDAKNILLLYRHGTGDANDPEIAAALALTKIDPELADWFEMHCARQFVISDKFRQIVVPAGLKEQIISEQAALETRRVRRPQFALAMTAAILLLAAMVGFYRHPWRLADDTLVIYQNQMVSTALRGYAMDLMTNDPLQIRSYLAQNHAPMDFVLPAALNQAVLTGCAVEGWQNTRVSMICFRTAKAVAAGGGSDLWLFVADRASVKGGPAEGAPQFSKVNRLITATWTQGGKIYLLGVEGDEQTIKQYL